MRKIDIIIPTKNNVENLVSCISALSKAIPGDRSMKVNLLIIDNYSSKSSRKDYLNKVLKYDSFKNIIISTTFLGKSYSYAKLLNIGIDISNRKKTKAEYIAIVNDNIKVEETWVDSLLEELDSNKDIIGVSSTFSNIKNEFNYNACMFRFGELKKFDENLISLVNEEEFLKSYEKDKLLMTKKSIIDYTYETNETMNKAIELNIQIKNSFKGKGYVLYTFIGKNDQTPEITKLDKKFEYVCFTTKSYLDINPIWKTFDVSIFKDALNLNEDQLKEFIKLHPHFFFEKMNSSLWIDFSKIDDILTSDYTEILFKMNKNNFILAPESSTCDCSYKKLLSFSNSGKISLKTFNEILSLYKWFNLKPGCGMIDSSMIFFKHNDSRCINALNRIWTYVNKFNSSDELFMNLILYVNKYNYSYIPSILLYEKYFKIKEMN